MLGGPYTCGCFWLIHCTARGYRLAGIPFRLEREFIRVGLVAQGLSQLRKNTFDF